MSDITPEGLLETLNGAPKTLHLSLREMSRILREAALDGAMYVQLADAYVDFTKRYWAMEELGSDMMLKWALWKTWHVRQ
ncbi:MAG: hypothetical protein HY513_03350 [Candidatus Aenigmarchaeota archaeon]|nr:hypothetical protein [Candidatus Aenigmarchaeota archaeon]